MNDGLRHFVLLYGSMLFPIWIPLIGFVPWLRQ